MLLFSGVPGPPTPPVGVGEPLSAVKSSVNIIVNGISVAIIENLQKVKVPSGVSFGVSVKPAVDKPVKSIVANFEGKNYVFIVKAKNKFEMLEIKTGNSENGFTEICSSELLQNKTIVVKGAYQLLMANKNKEE